MKDVWKPIPGYEGLYSINNNGQVYSIRSNKMLKPFANEKGYMRVCLQNNGNIKRFRVHRLVAQTFIPNPQGKPTVDHINGIRSDNRAENLRWATMEEQNGTEARRKSVSHSMLTSPSIAKKKRPVLQLDMSGRVLTVHDGLNDAARAVNSTAGNIYSCCNGQRKSCKGYIFQYADSLSAYKEVQTA